MPYQRLEDILRPTTTPEQANFLNWFYTYFNVGGGLAHRTILNVEPLYYFGAVAGTEFLTYNISKLYILYNFKAFCQLGIPQASSGYLRFYDESNNISSEQHHTDYPVYITSSDVVKYFMNPLIVDNFYFSRFGISQFDSILFNGYRITLN